MVQLQGGVFDMGADEGNKMVIPGGINNEKPIHEVELEPFSIDIYPVSNYEYEKFVKATNYITYSEKAPKAEDWPGALPEMLVPASIVFKQPKHKVDMRNYYNWWEYKPGANWKHPEGPQSDIKDRGNHPVVHVTYEDAKAYCEWQGKTLPTEAQWEYAARGGLKKKKFIWGDQPKHLTEEVMNFWRGDFPYSHNNTSGVASTTPVGSFPANGFGLYDMAGNVWEWSSDWYHPRYFEVSPRKNPIGVKKQDSLDPNDPGVAKKVVKGGSFLCSEKYCMGYRPSARMATDPMSSSNHIGFRCVKNNTNHLSQSNELTG